MIEKQIVKKYRRIPGIVSEGGTDAYIFMDFPNNLVARQLLSASRSTFYTFPKERYELA